MDIDASLDTLVLQVAKHLIDDYPANDPRWLNHRDLCKKIKSFIKYYYQCATITHLVIKKIFSFIIFTVAFTLNAVLTMQIPHQLEGKQKAMELYITFLKEHCLWNRVSVK